MSPPSCMLKVVKATAGQGPHHFKTTYGICIAALFGASTLSLSCKSDVFDVHQLEVLSSKVTAAPQLQQLQWRSAVSGWCVGSSCEVQQASIARGADACRNCARPAAVRVVYAGIHL